MPVFADSTYQAGASPSRNIVDRTEGKSTPHIAGGPLLCRQIIIVLRNRRLEHRRAEIRCVAEIFRPRVIRQQGETARVTPPDVNVTLLPDLRDRKSVVQ